QAPPKDDIPQGPSNADLLDALIAALACLVEDFPESAWTPALAESLSRLSDLGQRQSRLPAFRGMEIRHQLIGLGKRAVHVDKRARTAEPWDFRDNEVFLLIRALESLVARLDPSQDRSDPGGKDGLQPEPAPSQEPGAPPPLLRLRRPE
ncbi:MAG: hypothetical protein ACPGYL_04065, partial [Rhodospirillaceae bacterium]